MNRHTYSPLIDDEDLEYFAHKRRPSRRQGKKWCLLILAIILLVLVGCRLFSFSVGSVKTIQEIRTPMNVSQITSTATVSQITSTVSQVTSTATVSQTALPTAINLISNKNVTNSIQLEDNDSMNDQDDFETESFNKKYDPNILTDLKKSAIRGEMSALDNINDAIGFLLDSTKTISDSDRAFYLQQASEALSSAAKELAVDARIFDENSK
jgi:hypothetical protein